MSVSLLVKANQYLVRLELIHFRGFNQVHRSSQAFGGFLLLPLVFHTRKDVKKQKLKSRETSFYTCHAEQEIQPMSVKNQCHAAPLWPEPTAQLVEPSQQELTWLCCRTNLGPGSWVSGDPPACSASLGQWLGTRQCPGSSLLI